MSKNIIATVCATTLLLSSSGFIYTNPIFKGDLVTPTQQLHLKTDKEKVDNFIKYVDDYVKEQERLQKIEQYKQAIELERQRMAEIERRKQQEQNKLKQYDRGGNTTYNKMEVNYLASYYTNHDDPIQGGQMNKLGTRRLDSYNIPICALPKNIPYGSLVEIDGILYMAVDTGGAIVWQGDVMRVDIFIPNIDPISINKMDWKKGKAILYIKNN